MMDAQQFAYWLNGFAELSGDAPPTEAQWKAIREHLELVFRKVTPPAGLPEHLQKMPPLDHIRSQAARDTYWWLRQPQCSGTPLPKQAQSIC